jgi:NAD(P)-dependent dehydrogenase (short-subunit alcohol dehydrogenase family)
VSDRVALVTGSTSGIGAAIARRLAHEGYAVALHGRRSADAGRTMAAELPGASYHQADLADEAATRDLVAGVVKQHGRLDVLVNNAGESIRIPHADLKAATPAVWRRMLDINLIAPFVLTAEAEAALRQSAEGGRPACIVNIGTHAAVRPKGSVHPLRRG